MSSVEWILVRGADLVLGVWEAMATFLTWAWSLVNAVCEPILSPLLSWLNPLCTTAGDLVYRLLEPLPIWLGLSILSAMVGVLMLIAFRYLSNQTAIGQAKDDIKANLLALKLFKDELHVTFTAQWRLLIAVLKLQRYVLTPVLICTLPMLLGLAQMGLRYQWRPLKLDEQTVITITLASVDSSSIDSFQASTDLSHTNLASMPEEIILMPNDALAIEVDAIPGGGTITWRVRAVLSGRHQLVFRVGEQTITKEWVVSESFARVNPIRSQPGWVNQLLYPAESTLPADSRMASIEIDYPESDSWFHGANWWVITFFILSMAAALILKPLFRVKF